MEIFLVRICERENLTNLKRCLCSVCYELDGLKQTNDKKKIFYICDNVSDEFFELIQQFVDQLNENISNQISYSIIREDSKNKKEFTSQHYTLYKTSIDIVKDFPDEENNFYFIEDDYLFSFGALEKTRLAIQDNPKDFYAFFDHPDRYKNREKENYYKKKQDVVLGGVGKNEKLTRKGYEKYKLDIKVILPHLKEICYWRTSISSCHSFACNYLALKENKDFFLENKIQRNDHNMWTQIWGSGDSKLWTPINSLGLHTLHKPFQDLHYNEKFLTSLSFYDEEVKSLDSAK